MNSTFFYKISPLLTLGSFGVIKGHIPTQKRSSIDTLTRNQFVCELYNEIGGLKKLAKVLHTDIEIMKHLHPQILEKRQQRQGSKDNGPPAVDQGLSMKAGQRILKFKFEHFH